MKSRAKKATFGEGLFVAVAAGVGVALTLKTGDLNGPLAPLCLLPAGAAAWVGRRDLMPLGGALTVASLALAAVGDSLGMEAMRLNLPAWTGAAALALAGLLVAAGLVRSARDRPIDTIDRVLSAQGALALRLDREGRVLDAAGPGADGMVGDSIGRLVADEALVELAQAIHRAGNEGEGRVLAPARDSDGTWLIALRKGVDGGLSALVLDGAASAARERELVAARDAAEQRDAGKSRFLANMSHELRTPLNAIMGFSDIMRQRLFGPLADRYAEYAELIHESGSHLLELINDVLDMSKIEAERFELALEDQDARDPITAVLRLMRGQADRAGVNLRAALPADPVEVRADRRALKQIALNLISNALKFTPKGGAVTLSLEASGDELLLKVADTGVGISAGDLARLGRPFEQAGDAERRAAGSGLGLSLVRAFAGLHGGTMRIQSVMGEGTVVEVRLPVLISPDALLRQA